jgi:hypothetical protein
MISKYCLSLNLVDPSGLRTVLSNLDTTRRDRFHSLERLGRTYETDTWIRDFLADADIVYG